LNPWAIGDARKRRALIRQAGEFAVESGLAAGMAAVSGLLLLVLVWRISVPIGLGLAVGVYLGVMLLLPEQNADLPVVDGLDGSELQQVLAAGADAVARLGQQAEHITTPTARMRVLAIGVTASRILGDFQEHPDHLSEARFAFEALMGAALAAVARYRKFDPVQGQVARRAKALLEDRVLPTVERGLQQLLDRLMNDDLRALNVDTEVLEQMLDLEGLSADAADHEAPVGPAMADAQPGDGQSMSAPSRRNNRRAA
jgi:hypothetical protein